MKPFDVQGEPRGSAHDSQLRADVCLVLEGTYPYVNGGVSTWTHDLIGSLPDLRFALVHVGPERGAYTRMHYSLPANVVSLSNVYCREPPPARHRHADAGRSSRVLRGIRRLHLEDEIDSSLLDDLASGDLSPGAFLHGRASFELTTELRLLAAEPPAATVYHSLCTGYAGLLAAVWGRRAGRPSLLTEHGIYARERNLELDRAPWLRGTRDSRGADGMLDDTTVSALRRMWARFFCALARCAYAGASTVVSICDANRQRQIADGAPADRTVVVPNGIDLDGLGARVRGLSPRTPGRHPLRVAFVGRLVPIKDVVTFIHACFLALQAVELDVRIIGPVDEDPRYARRCRRLVARLGLERAVRFEGALPIERVYSEIDVLVLTSFSEGQPLVILEAGAAGIPVVASDAGACRELLEGRRCADREIGPSGIVTRLAAPEDTAAAIIRLARDPEERRLMGAAGRRRVATFYRKSATVSAYRALYTWPWPE